MRSVIFTLILVFTLSTPVMGIVKFTTDGCTGAPDGSWGHCCYEHDLLYWRGGDREARLQADERLKQCVNDSGGPGYVFYDFVRSMGPQYWSRAWEDRNLRGPLTEWEQEQIRNEKKLWESLNRPSRFEFVISESLLFQKLNPERRSILLKEFASIKASSEYQDFLDVYQSMTSRVPLTESW